MAKTNWQDPKSSEIISPHISGLQEAVGKLEESLGISSVVEEGILLSEVYIAESDRYRIYQAPEGKRNWLSSPTPIIKKNGVQITTGFIIEYGGGAIVFTTPLSGSDVVAADVTYTIKEATSLKELINTLGSHKALSQISGQSIAVNTETAIIFPDTSNAYFDIVSGIITIKKTGTYIIIAKASIANATADGVDIKLVISRNNTTLVETRYKHCQLASGSWAGYNISCIDIFVAGQTIELKLTHEAASAINSQWSNLYIAYMGAGGGMA